MKGHTHQKKHQQQRRQVNIDLEFTNKEYGEIYATVLKSLGDGRFLISNFNTNEEVTGKIKGNFRKGSKKEKIEIGNLVKAEPGITKGTWIINHKYRPDEIIKLEEYGEIKNANVTIVTAIDNIDNNDNTNIDNVDINDIWDEI
jgi:hypothetical protein